MLEAGIVEHRVDVVADDGVEAGEVGILGGGVLGGRLREVVCDPREIFVGSFSALRFVRFVWGAERADGCSHELERGAVAEFRDYGFHVFVDTEVAHCEHHHVPQDIGL